VVRAVRCAVGRWFEGIYLLDRVSWVETGCWLLVNGREAAVLELPPAVWGGPDPVPLAVAAAAALGVDVRYLVCTHAHLDHFSRPTLRRMRAAFPAAVPVLQAGFRGVVGEPTGVIFFDDAATLALDGEPLHLLHAPKHSGTDTMVVFRGAVCTGDWELETLRTVHDWNPIARVPVETRVRSCERMMAFPGRSNYAVHRVFSVHGTDRRENVDFPALMAATREDRQLW